MKKIEMKKTVSIPIDPIILEGNLNIPETAQGIVIFSHGSGSGRFSSRNNFVAGILQDAGFATLLFDLLTEKEDEVYENRFNIPLLTERLEAVSAWLRTQPETRQLAQGYFGASTGAASALMAAAKLQHQIKAVVSRGGRPDMASEELSKVTAPTLLIVGGRDDMVIPLNQIAYEEMTCVKQIETVPGATHLFEEPGKLEIVAHLSAQWFEKYLKQFDHVQG